jgi:hypothetical protein
MLTFTWLIGIDELNGKGLERADAGVWSATAALPHKCMQVHMRSRINHHTNRGARSAGQMAIS